MVFTIYFVQYNNHLVFRVRSNIEPNLQLYTRTYIFIILYYTIDGKNINDCIECGLLHSKNNIFMVILLCRTTQSRVNKI